MKKMMAGTGTAGGEGDSSKIELVTKPQGEEKVEDLTAPKKDEEWNTGKE